MVDVGLDRRVVGVVESTEAAQTDRAGSIEVMKASTEYSAEEIESMVPDTLPLLTPPSGLPTGCLNLEAWDTFGEWMLDNELLERPVDPAMIATNDYLPGC